MRSLSLACVLLAAGLMSTTTQAAIEASVDSTRVAPGETISLTLAHDGNTNSQPDIAPLKRDFDVLSTSRSSNVRIVNGSMSSETQLRLTLSPRRSGQLTIPALTWGNEQSSPIAITIDSSGAPPAGTTQQAQSSNVFLETRVDDSRPYVQGAVKLTVRLLAGVQLYNASLDLPASSDVLVEQLGKDRSSRTQRNGRSYDVIERDYLLFPQHSGALQIPGPVLDARVPSGSRSSPFPDDAFSGLFDNFPLADMMQTARPIRIHGDNISLDVRPRPPGATTSYWIPAKNLTLTSERQPDSLEVHAGEPITLDVRLRAEGLTAAQLPDIASLLQLPPGLRAYPDEPKLENSAQSGTAVGERDQSVALIADHAGNFDVPALEIQWWDTSVDQPRTVELPALTIKALPAVAGTSSGGATSTAAQGATGATGNGGMQQSNASPLAEASAHSRWVILVTLTTLLVAAAALWWLYQQRASARSITPRAAPLPGRDEARARREFLAACKLNDARSARRALLEWTQARWPNSPPLGLRDVAVRLDDPEITTLLLELDRACFAGAPWNSAALAKALERLPEPSGTKHPARRSDLAELYPQA
ncbi:BatD family protein [Povalibacter sp.]|uniref:BatD family protein n=1 Tax=Povalibacter sp. TaxID=1962978 RepID=UPI002F429B6B